MSSGTDRPPARPLAPELRSWRLEVLVHAGFEEGLARRLASSAEVDLHDVLRLLDDGCPPHLAARIVAPLHDGPGRGG